MGTLKILVNNLNNSYFTLLKKASVLVGLFPTKAPTNKIVTVLKIKEIHSWYMHFVENLQPCSIKKNQEQPITTITITFDQKPFFEKNYHID